MPFLPDTMSLHTESSGFISVFSESNCGLWKCSDCIYNSKCVLGKIARIVYFIPHTLAVQLYFCVWFVFLLMELLLIPKSVNIYYFSLYHKGQKRNRAYCPCHYECYKSLLLRIYISDDSFFISHCLRSSIDF